MTSRRVLAVTAALCVLLLARNAAGDCDPAPCRLKTPATITTDGGTSVRVPPGRFLSETTWLRLDAEVRRLQDAETRLTVENKSLKESAGSPGWGLIGGIALGLVGGITLALSL